MDEVQFARERAGMVADQLVPRGIKDPRVLKIFETVPRHAFVPKEELQWAYGDYPLPIGHGQTISQPYIVALMTEKLQLTGSERVLEIGTGSGYQAAILSSLAIEIHTVEVVPELAESAMKNLMAMGVTNVHVHVGDGSLGLPAYSPYDAIMVTAAAPRMPSPLLDQLSEGGHVIIPIGDRGYQELELWTHGASGNKSETIIPVAFVPLRGQYGWDKNWHG